MVTLENYEEYILLLVDGELMEEEEKALRNFLSLHPELKQELTFYESAVLKPAPEIGFPDKEKLLKKEISRGISPLRKTWIYSAAAGLAAFFLWLGISDLQEPAEKVPQFVQTKSEPEKENFNGEIKPNKIRSEEHTSELQSRENLVCRL